MDLPKREQELRDFKKSLCLCDVSQKLLRVGGLNLAISPAAGQSAESLDPAAVTRAIDPASIIDAGSILNCSAACC